METLSKGKLDTIAGLVFMLELLKLILSTVCQLFLLDNFLLRDLNFSSEFLNLSIESEGVLI